jgi:WD40 repeat protein
VRLWNIHTLVCVAVFGGERGHREQVLTAAFNDDGTRFVSAGMDHCLKVWNLEHPRLNEVRHEGERGRREFFLCICFGPANRCHPSLSRE